MDDFRPRRPAQPGLTPSVQPQQSKQPLPVQPNAIDLTLEPPAQLNAKQPNKAPRRKRMMWVGVVLVVIVAILLGGFLWFQQQLSPVNKNDTSMKLVTISSGSTPDEIASELASQQVIRSAQVFLWYTKITGTQHVLQAGVYRLSPSESTPQVVEHLTKGNVDAFDITFLPGATLAQNKAVFLKAGYSEQEVDAAFAKSYSSPLFEAKPANADLEGYILGNTYRFGAGTSVEAVLEHIFELYYEEVVNNNLVEGFKQQGLNLYEGITLASIIQRESIGGDEPQIAQVFYLRLSIDMPLGSDVTYQYIADKMGVTRDTNLDSPYNTRRYPGLPPGPIAVPGIAALKAAANPAEGDYLYFLSGDDDITYFSRTLEGHEQNIVEHCQKKCQII